MAENEKIVGLKPGTAGFAVLRLSTEITLADEAVEIGNLLGFLPVFATEEEAVAASDNGKYKILNIILGDGETEAIINA